MGEVVSLDEYRLKRHPEKGQLVLPVEPPDGFWTPGGDGHSVISGQTATASNSVPSE